jgi:hypothetical protein
MLKHALVCLLAIAVSGPTLAQSQPAPVPAYRPGLGDLMTMTVQPRHLKVGLAGEEKNWAYAAYELHELQEAFDRVARYWPKWRQVEIADTLKATLGAPMEALAQAIGAEDSSKFSDSYRRLTATCNACHQGAKVGLVVIQVPKNSPFANQDFRRLKP